MVILRGDLIKAVVLGDDGVGKTSMLMNYATNKFPYSHVPKLFDNYAGSIEVAGRQFRLHLLDSSGEVCSLTLSIKEDASLEETRQSCYGTVVIVICFSIVKPKTFINLKQKWLPEVQRAIRDTPVVILGTHADMRSDPEVIQDLQSFGETPVSYREAASWSRRVGAAGYIEISPLMKKRLRCVMNDALISVFSPKEKHLGARCFML